MNRSSLIGLAAALGVVCFWAGWLIVSRYGVTNTLTIYDVNALRFGVGSLAVLPWVVGKRTWRGLTPGRVAVLALSGGVPYALLSFYAFLFAPAAHGGVFLNGALPIFTALIAWWWLGVRRTGWQITGLAVIICGVLMVGWDGLINPPQGGESAWLGDLLFLTAIAMFALFMAASNRWSITPGQIVFSVTFVGAIYYLPLWYLVLPSRLSVAPWSEIALQGLYQGLVPSILGISCLSIAIKHIGANATSVFLSFVPVLAGLAGFVFLGEQPGPLAWLGMVAVSGGVLLGLGLKTTGRAVAATVEVD